MTPEEERKDRMQDYLICFSTESGKRVLRDLQRAYDKSCFDSDPLLMAYKEGKRDVVLSIRYLMEQVTREKGRERQVRAE